MSPADSVTVVRISSPVPTEANYRITLVTTHTRPHIDHAHVIFTTTLAQQETRLLITLMSHDQPAKLPGKTMTTTPDTNPVPTKSPISDDSMNIIVIVVTIVVIIIATFLICMAVRQGSSAPKSGFTAHLPPKRTPQAAFTPHTPSTPFTQGTPPHSSGGGSAFRRPPYTPSPQHGLFSQ